MDRSQKLHDFFGPAAIHVANLIKNGP